MYIRPRERGGGLTEPKIADLVFSLALLVALNVVYYLNLPHHVTGAIISAGQAAMFSGFVGLAVYKVSRRGGGHLTRKALTRKAYRATK